MIRAVSYFLFCLAVALLAEHRGRGAALWLLWALIISPLVAAIVLLLLPRRYIECEVLYMPQVMRRRREPWSRL